MIDKNALLKLIDNHKIKYKIHTHKPLYTVKDSIDYRGKIEGAHTKNIFLKNKKNEFFLFSCLESTVIDLKSLRKNLKLGNISFAKDEYLLKLLNVIPGSVTPFGLLNDIDKKISFYIDMKLNNYELLNFHPLKNTFTITMKKEDFYKFLKYYGIKIKFLNFDSFIINDDY